MTGTRRERQKIANREAILDAALRIAERESWSAVTIRRIADEIDYTSPIIYQHFANKDAALEVLLQRGYDDLQATLTRAVEAAPPNERPLQLGLAYLRFARESPTRYELMNGLGGIALNGDARHAACVGVTAVTTDVLTSWAAYHNVKLEDPRAACETAWGIVHGMASLALLQEISFDRAERLATEATRALLQYWESS